MSCTGKRHALIIRAKPYWAAFNASSYIKELTLCNIWLVHGYSNDIFQADLDALLYISPEVAHNPAVFPSREQQAHLEMLHDLDRHQRRVLSRIWTEIKLR